MLRYLFLRVLYTLPVIWLVVSLVFLLIHLVPGDPIQQMLGEGAPAADLQAARHAYGLDLPLGQQYLNYWKGVLQGNLGVSLRYNQSVSKLLRQRYPYTLQLTLAALLVAIVLSVPAGVHSARRRNDWDDRVITVLGLQFGALLAGAIVTEKIFSWPGVGRLTVDAISNRDYYVVQGCILAIGLTYVAVNFLTDLVYSALNPRIRQ